MADFQVSEDYRCGYCYQQFNSMTDPRELPCHHVFCLPCLEEDYSEHNNVNCRSCLTEHDMETFDDLPAAQLATEVIPSTTSLTCDCHNCDGQVAVCYCIDCGFKMCDTHEQAHNSFAGDKHQTIPISTYQLHPGMYKKVMCKQHGGEVFEICDKCNATSCKRCHKSKEICPDTGNCHTFSSLNTLKEEITSHFNSLLQSASNKLTEICKVDKQIWKVLDEEEVECAERIQMIERIRDEQIELIREESEKLKEQIYEYQRELTEQVESYNTDLMTKKERLEESCTEVSKWMRESHMSEKVEERQQMTDMLVNNTDVELDCPLQRTPALVHTGKPVFQQPKLVTTPTSITLLSQHATDTPCYSAVYKAQGELLLGCLDGIRILKEDRLTMMKVETTHRSNTSVLHCTNNIHYFLTREGDERTVYQCLDDFTKRQKLFSFNYSGTIAAFVAASKDYCVATNPGDKKLAVYKFSSRTTISLTPDTPPSAVHFLPDGDLLVLSRTSRALIRYRIENGELITIWTCEVLEEPAKLTSDADGFIYLGTLSRQLYILSPAGKILEEISNNDLPGNCGQISVRGRDELAVPTWEGNSVCLFKINH